MKEQNKSNKKFLWGILLGVVTILLCYMFVVLYFFFISPNNISVKLALWPFLSDKNIGQIYVDATVEIKLGSGDEQAEVQIIGVNVREDGFVIAPFHQIKNMDEGDIKIYCNSGKVFDGKLLYAEENFDLAILKCENSNAVNSKIRLPFVKLCSLNSDLAGEEVLSISSPLEMQPVRKGEVDNNFSDAVLTKKIDNFVAVDHVIENGNAITFNSEQNDKNGAVFDLYGNLLGFSFADVKNAKGESVILPAENANLFLQKVLDLYSKNQTFSDELANAFSGMDVIELSKHFDVSDEPYGMSDHFLFNGKWETYSKDLIKFYNANLAGYYLLEDFAYSGNEIQAGNIITGLKIGNNKVEIKTKTDLFQQIYSTKEGQNLQIEFMSIADLQTRATSIVV